MQVTVQLADEIARALARRAPDAAIVSALRQLEEALGIRLHAQHPDTRDPALRRWYLIDLPDAASSSQTLTALRAHPLVAAAYIKPADAMP